MGIKRTREEFEQAAKNSYSLAAMCRQLGLKPCGGNYRIVHNAIDKYSIDTNHFKGQGWNVGLKFKPVQKKTLREILVINFF